MRGRNRIMKKFLAFILALSMTGAFAACAKETPQETEQTGEKTYKIGIVQLVEHEALSAARLGFIDGLKEAGLEDGKNIKIDYQNAAGEQANCVTIADKLVNDNSDLILAIATPAAQAVANKTSDIPVLVTAVTDPAGAKLVETNAAPGGNVTGTSDMAPIEKQIELLNKLAPNAKNIAMLYCSSEANSKIQVEIAKEQCEALGLSTFEATVSNTNEIQQVVQSLVGKADAIYVPTDNMIASSMATVAMVTTEAGIPIIVGEEGPVKNGGLATYGLSYYNLGKQTAAQAVKILVDGEKPAVMPIEYLENTDLFINEDVAEALGIKIPDELKEKAQFVKTNA
ncbi:MAG: ABC transporter substrate-binding protein [Oscillospiraceae bacterium]